jgi:branched-subunit amino acid ABC-type transport system permease component
MAAVIWLDSLILASTYILVASGLVLVFSIMGILNFAHGQFYMLGAFVIFIFSRKPV